MEATETSMLRWVSLLVASAAGAGLVFWLGGFLLDSVFYESLGVIPLLLAAYAALAAGYVFTAVGTRLAPRRRYTVAVGLVFVMVAVAAALMLRESATEGPFPAALLGTSLVVGAFGYALRVRGFTEAITGRES